MAEMKGHGVANVSILAMNKLHGVSIFCVFCAVTCSALVIEKIGSCNSRQDCICGFEFRDFR